MNRVTYIAGVLSVLAWPIIAETPFDGLYVATGVDGWTCEPGEVGMEFGALAIRDDKLWGLENTCDLTNPTNVRGMAGVLYDAECSGEGETYAYRLMLLKGETGIYLIENGYIVEWTTCK